MAKSGGAMKMHETPHKGHAANMSESAIRPSHGHAANMGETVGSGLTSGSCPPIGKGMSAPNIPNGMPKKGGF